ncbi:MAG TPA: hypothetical protein VFU01_17965 [Gemmatimonadaceae bacterium]|nr:hypothetical protein [Gemmatimonadaceae bacterium]
MAPTTAPTTTPVRASIVVTRLRHRWHRSNLERVECTKLRKSQRLDLRTPTHAKREDAVTERDQARFALAI